MRAKLLKKLRRKARKRIHIHSVTRSGDLVIGMQIGYDESYYSGIFELGMNEEDVLIEAEKRYIKNYLEEKKQ